VAKSLSPDCKTARPHKDSRGTTGSLLPHKRSLTTTYPIQPKGVRSQHVASRDRSLSSKSDARDLVRAFGSSDGGTRTRRQQRRNTLNLFPRPRSGHHVER
jgi:hypothetical protein